MYDLFQQNLRHVLFLLLLMARLGDVLSTRFATPTLKLESNPVARKLGWPYIFASVGVAPLPYLSLELGIIVLVFSLMLCAENLARLWLIRALGEEGYLAVVRSAVAASSFPRAMISVMGKVFFLLALAFSLWLCTPAGTLARAFAAGIAAHAAFTAWVGTWQFRRLFRDVRGRGGGVPAK